MKNLLMTGIVAAALSSVSVAADFPKFGTVEANQDGVITVEEAAVLKDLDFDFSKVDTNDDDVIDHNEYDHVDD